MRSVYLSGSILGLDYEQSNDWREYAKNWLAKYGIVGCSPMRFKEFLKGRGVINDDFEHFLTTPKALFARDRYDVKSCDVMLANLLGAKRISIGTVVEYAWADAFGKPIVTIMEKEGNVHEHNFIRELSGFSVETLEDGLHAVRTILTP